MRSVVRLVLCLSLCFGASALGAYFTAKGIPVWYKGLIKPSWTPPNAAFPIVWSALYLMMAISLFLLWDRTPPSEGRTRAITLFLVQFALNAIWSPVFFGLQSIWGIWSGLVIILLLAVAIILTIRAAWPVQRVSGLLLLPYLAWVLYASTINAGVGILNGGAG